MTSDENDRISTSRILELLVKRPFGTYILSEGRIGVAFSAQSIGNKTFFADRMKINPTKPINDKAASHLMTLYKLMLLGLTKQNRFVASSFLADALSEAAGKNLSKTAIGRGETKGRQQDKIDIQLRLLDKMLLLARDAEYILKSVFAVTVRGIMRGPEQNPTVALNSLEGASSELRFIPDSVAEADFARLITSTEHAMDLVFVHGTKWFDMCRSSLLGRLLRGNVRIRVALCDPSSGFAAPYAMLKESGEMETRVKSMIDKIYAANAEWKKLATEAVEKGAEGISLELYYFNQTPSQAFYRFDQRIVFCPTRNFNAESNVFPAIECVNTGYMDSAYNSFLDEIEALLRSGRKVYRNNVQDRKWMREKTVSSFVRGLFTTCFGSIVVDFEEWAVRGSRILPPRDFLEKRIEASTRPVDDSTARDIVSVFETAFEGGAMASSIELSDKYIEYMRNACQIDLHGYAFDPEDDRLTRQAKCRCLVDSLYHVLSLSIGQDGFEPADAASIIAMTSFNPNG